MESSTIAGKILGTSQKVSYLADNLKFNIDLFFILDILFVAVLIYYAYIFLKETKAMTILYGMAILLVLAGIGKILDLTLLNWILKSVATGLIVAIPVVFQPELRTALERLGRSKFIGDIYSNKEESVKMIDAILNAAQTISHSKTGALIVIKRQTGLKEYIDNGISLDSEISSEMLRTLFFPKSPLHDGAVIVADGRIISARSILPVSSTDLNYDLGTRHKAGLGITEDTDAIAVIVSEETGSISMAINGKLEHKITLERLKNRLIANLRNYKKNA